jgi:hypothetical protein
MKNSWWHKNEIGIKGFKWFPLNFQRSAIILNLECVRIDFWEGKFETLSHFHYSWKALFSTLCPSVCLWRYYFSGSLADLARLSISYDLGNRALQWISETIFWDSKNSNFDRYIFLAWVRFPGWQIYFLTFYIIWLG